MTLMIIKSIDKNSNSGIISDTAGSPQTFKELNMPRTKIEIDKFQLMTIINRVENANTFTTRNALAEAVAAEFPLDISSAVILLRIKEFDIEPKTPNVNVFMRDFWQRFPNGLKVSNNGKVNIEFYPAWSKQFFNKEVIINLQRNNINYEAHIPFGLVDHYKAMFDKYLNE